MPTSIFVIAFAGRHGLIMPVRASCRATRGCRSWWRVPSGCRSGCSWCWCAAGNFSRATLPLWPLPCTGALSSPPSLSRTGCCHTPVRTIPIGQPRRSSGGCGCRSPGVRKTISCRPMMMRCSLIPIAMPSQCGMIALQLDGLPSTIQAAFVVGNFAASRQTGDILLIRMDRASCLCTISAPARI